MRFPWAVSGVLLTTGHRQVHKNRLFGQGGNEAQQVRITTFDDPPRVLLDERVNVLYRCLLCPAGGWFSGFPGQRVQVQVGQFVLLFQVLSQGGLMLWSPRQPSQSGVGDSKITTNGCSDRCFFTKMVMWSASKA